MPFFFLYHPREFAEQLERNGTIMPVQGGGEDIVLGYAQTFTSL